MYWAIMGALLLVAVVLIVAIVVTLKKSKTAQEVYDDEYDDEYDDYDDEYDEEEENDDYDEPAPLRRRRSMEPLDQNTRPVVSQTREIPQRSMRRQWKLILEDLDTWEQFDYTFYDNVGIGRSQNNSEFERFLIVKDDSKVSKVHCAIVYMNDQLYLKDLGSKNGTYLNGERIYHPMEIQKDDVISLGQTKIEVRKVLRERI